jgi:GNAT superfamily N-acetyltransferase/predicted DCC family thiol-disulfide oxidoreductase YuxK
MNGVLLYDGDCGFCETSAHWLERHARSPARVEAWQDADLVRLGLSAEECAEAVLWVENGQRAVGPEAVAAYLRGATSPWQTAGRLLRAPVSKHVARPVFRWATQHRDGFPGGTTTDGPSRDEQPVKGLRRRRARDVGACVRLLRVVFYEDRYPATWPDGARSWLEGEEVVDAWVVERHGELLGHVAISHAGLDPLSALRWRELTGQPPERLAAVSRLFVRPRARREGIGAALLEAALTGIRDRGLTPVLEVVSSWEGADAFVESRGWRLVAMYPWGDPGERSQVFYYEPVSLTSRGLTQPARAVPTVAAQPPVGLPAPAGPTA